MPTVREFVYQSYRLINASNPTVPLHGDDQELAITILNQLLQSYASTGLLITIAKTFDCPLTIGQENVVIGPPSIIEPPDIQAGRLAHLEAAWLILSGVTYPLIVESKGEFFASWKFDPLKGLPRFVIVLPDTDVVRLRLYPAPSQFFQFFLRGKFQLPILTANDSLDLLPQYYTRYLLFAVARDVAMYKGRSEAWTEQLNFMFNEARDQMEAASEQNMDITGDLDSLLNGSWRVMAGI